MPARGRRRDQPRRISKLSARNDEISHTIYSRDIGTEHLTSLCVANSLAYYFKLTSTHKLQQSHVPDTNVAVIMNLKKYPIKSGRGIRESRTPLQEIQP